MTDLKHQQKQIIKIVKPKDKRVSNARSCHLLGIEKLIVGANKMDDKYNEIRAEVEKHQQNSDINQKLFSWIWFNINYLLKSIKQIVQQQLDFICCDMFTLCNIFEICI